VVIDGGGLRLLLIQAVLPFLLVSLRWAVVDDLLGDRSEQLDDLFGQGEPLLLALDHPADDPARV